MAELGYEPAAGAHGPLGIDEATGRALLAALRDDDPVAPSDFAALYLPPLAAWLARLNPGADEHQTLTAAEDTILDLLRRPERYDAARGSLDTYLRLSARRDLLNLWAREGRHSARRADLEDVELSPRGRERLHDAHADPARIVQEREDEETMRRLEERSIPEALRRRLSAAERGVLQLMREGERGTPAYAGALGIDHLAPEEQRRQVKRVKDRLQKRLARAEPSDG